jgi:acyl-CoA synthetase (AMP-forming)/AMP-acid ligase II
MRIAGVGDRPPPAQDIAAALTGAVSTLGQRPAITGLRPDGRREQGFASLSGWVAKGANLLAGEFGLGPGDRIGLAGPPSWPLAAAALSAWWIGVTVVSASTDGIDLAVVHFTASSSAAGSAHAPLPSSLPPEVLWFGDALDATGDATGDVVRGSASPSGEWWADAVTPHPDRPPAAAHDGTLVALTTPDGSTVSQRALLDMLATDPGGAIGILRTGQRDVLQRDDAALLLATLALRPLVTGAASVVVEADDDRERIVAAERIARW